VLVVLECDALLPAAHLSRVAGWVVSLSVYDRRIGHATSSPSLSFPTLASAMHAP